MTIPAADYTGVWTQGLIIPNPHGSLLESGHAEGEHACLRSGDIKRFPHFGVVVELGASHRGLWEKLTYPQKYVKT